MKMSSMNESCADRRSCDRSTLEEWDRDDRSGGWDWLRGLDKLAHCVAVIGGYALPHSPAGIALLDEDRGRTSAAITLIRSHAPDVIASTVPRRWNSPLDAEDRRSTSA
jgi:hypothetical protein